MGEWGGLCASGTLKPLDGESRRNTEKRGTEDLEDTASGVACPLPK